MSETQIEITSYGVLHGDPPPHEPDVRVDLRTALRNPHQDPAMRLLTGLDPAVSEHVLATPGAQQIVRDTVAQSLAAAGGAHTVRVHTLCMGGRHRSVAVAEAIGASLRAAGVRVRVEHWHVGRAVVQR
jgi:UPF0042 nucleotide-binding protein